VVLEDAAGPVVELVLDGQEVLGELPLHNANFHLADYARS
jgi:hypothetical protein